MNNITKIMWRREMHDFYELIKLKTTVYAFASGMVGHINFLVHSYL